MALTKEQRQANMAKARATRMANIAARNREAAKTEPQALPPVAAKPVAAAPVPEPPSIENVVRDATEAGVVTPDPDKPETIPPNLFSGFTRRLEYFGEREGYVRRYFNDDKGGTNIRDAIKSGWVFVKRSDVQLNEAVTPRNNDLGSNVRQYVGTDEANQPMYAYLMEKPEWLWKLHNEGPGSRAEYHDKLREQIKAGTLGQKPGERRYSAGQPVPGSPSTLPPITMDTKITR
jgi:hypothetical protein